MIVILPPMDTVKSPRWCKQTKQKIEPFKAYAPATLLAIRAKILGAAANGETLQIRGSVNDQIRSIIGQCQAAGCAINKVIDIDNVEELDDEEQFLANKKQLK